MLGGVEVYDRMGLEGEQAEKTSPNLKSVSKKWNDDVNMPTFELCSYCAPNVGNPTLTAFRRRGNQYPWRQSDLAHIGQLVNSKAGTRS